MYFFFIENKLKNKKIKRDQMMDKEVSPIQNIMLKKQPQSKLMKYRYVVVHDKYCGSIAYSTYIKHYYCVNWNPIVPFM